jgi:serine palmitoyltransferase
VPEVEELKQPVITSNLGNKVKIAGNNRQMLNMISINPVALLGDKKLIETAQTTVDKYAVGACGPPGFYGTVDVHLELEKKIASFIGHEEAILYSQGFSAVSSVIPAFAKRGDIIICDEAINFSIQKGIQISRSTVYFYRHNDMNDLERILIQVNKDIRKKQLMRKFIITEGLFMTTADICDLPKLLELKSKYKYRLIIDEALSFGSLGANGRGVSEFYQTNPKDIDMIIGSLSHTLGLSGGFCASNDIAIEHQRLSGSAYVFSAALPPLFATAGIEALTRLENKPELFNKLQENIALFHSFVDNTPNFIFEGHDQSPILHLKIAKLPCTDQESPFKYVRACKGRSKVLEVTLGSTINMQDLWEAEVLQSPPI